MDPRLPPLSVEQARSILARLREPVQRGDMVLIGGQAIALWGAVLGDRTGADPVTSRDIDFQGTERDVRQAAELLGGEALIPRAGHHTPMSGVAVFEDDQGHRRMLDMLDAPFGMNAEEVRELAVEIEIQDGEREPLAVRVMHPRHCVESRVHNSRLSNKRTELGWAQLRASIAQAGAYTRLLLDEGEVKAAQRTNEALFAFAHRDRSCARSPSSRASRSSRRSSTTPGFPSASAASACRR